MRIAVFGASGGTGRPVVEQALARGHEARALVRDLSKLQVKHEQFVVIRGDVLDAAKVPVAYSPKGAEPHGHCMADPKMKSDCWTRMRSNRWRGSQKQYSSSGSR